MSDLTITHTPAEGTLLDGSSRGDGVNLALRDAPIRWKWSRNIGDGGAFFVLRSRDQVVPKRHGIERTAEILRAAGHTVTVTLDAAGERRSPEEQETDRADRTERRAERLEGRAERLAAESQAHYDRAKQLVENIPSGQPILVGHHSERGHRRVLDRSWAQMGKSVHTADASKEAARAAETAAAGQSLHESGPQTMRRIEKIDTDLREIQRRLDGCVRHPGSPYAHTESAATGRRREDLLAQKADLEEKRAHWQAHLERIGYRVWTADEFAKGDLVKERYGWTIVTRVNKKSLTVPHPEPRLAEHGHTWTVPYDRVSGRRFGLLSVATKSGTAVAAATLCREHHADEGLRELAEGVARDAEDMPKRLKWVSSTLVTGLRCSGCTPAGLDATG